MSYLKRKWERGVGMLEILIGVAITALIVVSALAIYDEIIIELETNKQTPHILTLSGKAGTFLQRFHRENCDGATGADVFTNALGVEANRIYNSAAGNGWGAAALATANNADAPCRRMHQGLRSMLKSTVEGGEAGGLYDTDDETEWFIGSAVDGWDVGVAVNASGVAVAATGGTPGVAGLIPAGVLEGEGVSCGATTNVTELAFAISVHSIEVCDKIMGRLPDAGGPDVVGCATVDEGEDNIDGAAALIMCYEI